MLTQNVLKSTKYIIELVQLKFKHLLPLEKLYSIKTGWSFVFLKKNDDFSKTFSHPVINAFMVFKLTGQFQPREVDTWPPWMFVEYSQLNIETEVNATAELIV